MNEESRKILSFHSINFSSEQRVRLLNLRSHPWMVSIQLISLASREFCKSLTHKWGPHGFHSINFSSEQRDGHYNRYLQRSCGFHSINFSSEQRELHQTFHATNLCRVSIQLISLASRERGKRVGQLPVNQRVSIQLISLASREKLVCNADTIW